MKTLTDVFNTKRWLSTLPAIVLAMAILLAGMPAYPSEVCANDKTVIPALSHFQQALALENDGTVWAWGWNYYGALGNGASGYGEESNVPTIIEQLNLGATQKAQPALVLTANPANTQTYPCDITLTATLSGADTLSGKTIRFSINGTLQQALTDANGVATYTIASPDVGKYIFRAYFAGNVYSNGATAADITSYRVENITTPTDPTKPTEPAQTEPNEPNLIYFSNPIVWVIITVGAIAVIAVVLVLVIRRR